MGLWSGIKYALNSRLGNSNFKSLDKLIDDVQSKTNDTFVQAQNANANAYEVKNRGVVKSVQSGSTQVSSSTSIPIARVDLNKAIVLLNATGQPSCYAHLSNNETLYLRTNATITVGWQVVEYY